MIISFIISIMLNLIGSLFLSLCKLSTFLAPFGSLLILTGLFSMSPLFLLFYFLIPSYWVMRDYFRSIFSITICFMIVPYFFTFNWPTEIFLMCVYIFLFNFKDFYFFLHNILLLLYGNAAFSWLSPKLFTVFFKLLFVLSSLFLLMSVLFVGYLSYKGYLFSNVCCIVCSFNF